MRAKGRERVNRFWTKFVMIVGLLALPTIFLIANPCEESHGQRVAPVLPNASLVTAQVLRYSIVNGKLLGIEPEQTLYSLTIEVLSAKRVDERTPSLVAAGTIIEAFSKEELSVTLYGQIIKAIVRLSGDEWGQRYWIGDATVVSTEEEASSSNRKACAIPVL